MEVARCRSEPCASETFDRGGRMVATPITQNTGTRSLNWKAAIWAGLIAGAVFVVVEMLMVQFALGQSMWGPPRMIAAIAMGEDVLPPPATFDLGILIVALIVHFILSIVFALILALLIHRVGLGVALATGAAYGLVLYIVNFYGMTAIFPWFAMARNWVSIFAHILFGFVAAWSYQKVRTTA